MHKAKMAPVLRRHEFEDDARLTMLAQADHQAVVGPLHERGLGPLAGKAERFDASDHVTFERHGGAAHSDMLGIGIAKLAHARCTTTEHECYQREHQKNLVPHDPVSLVEEWRS
ncbi:hypothetical protein MGN01_18360 [Methylobacterium gnaphalii]|uniref:Uncharacterized protein n=1 Tax=Methylobacterium gnaphalii TaxID=1010610 RepID=A0A512JJ60_9HYPH|nr:hypothetical protein MGN01_18360 [Methylobacterium gnaphalii]GLS48262.1 hypothetical protein GCM10007885_11060 [Methylobacterium gnaphalii]